MIEIEESTNACLQFQCLLCLFAVFCEQHRRMMNSMSVDVIKGSINVKLIIRH